MQDLDLHGMKLSDAKEEIFEAIKYAYAHKIAYFKVIHGYNNGTRIKEWIRNTKMFDKKIVREVSDDFFNSGVTVIYLNLRLD